MYEQIFRRVLHPLYEGTIKRRRTYRYLDEYERSQWADRDALERIQLAKLNALLDHCWRSVPFLASHWKAAGLRPRQLSAVSDLKHFPTILKSQIKENFNDMRSTVPVGPVLSKTTGGSTGDPFRFEYTQESYARRVAVMWRGYRWCGTDIGRRTAYVWGTGAPPSVWRGLKERVYHAAFNRIMLNSYGMTESNLRDFVSQLSHFGPRTIVGFVGPLRQLAEWVVREGADWPACESIITGAEALAPAERRLMEQAFRTPVYETYGCREVMLIGCECHRRQGLHLSADHLVVETIDESGRPTLEEPGRISLTDLHNYRMPMVRYLNGDVATRTLRPCECGRRLPLLQKVDGRVLEMIRTSGGRIVPGEYFIHAMLGFPEIKQFQIVQQDMDSLEVLIVKEGALAEDLVKRLAVAVGAGLGDKMKVDVRRVDAIPLTRSGKRRVTVSALGAGPGSAH